ncbi:LOW QUALITY PROTEIN: hypothetical protein PanWU01x14_239160 [Parasponia andersonii]|uniref:Uncharacterized protein n=1 Tax=Parasponia andersonii TaxID=3476 RepID=A0A2P5BH58_PARAD|nr:LOW QUALITY PROTEIN: hypothetical protein PanWU01x14_239160 [Parasponia andersonii]
MGKCHVLDEFWLPKNKSLPIGLVNFAVVISVNICKCLSKERKTLRAYSRRWIEKSLDVDSPCLINDGFNSFLWYLHVRLQQSGNHHLLDLNANQRDQLYI